MPRPGRRLDSLNNGGDDGWGVFYRARALKAQGVDVTDLTIGEHDIRTDPAILDAMHASARGGHTGYAMVPGVHALRTAVADRVQSRTGVLTAPENVLITPGGQAALFAAHMAACDPGDTALFVDPYYATYPATLRATGAKAVSIPTRAEDNFVPQPDDITATARRTGARSLLINSPNNPTGMVYPPDAITAIAEVARDNDLWLISDEVYETQIWDGTHLSPRAVPDMAGRTLVIGSLSKSHAMTGSRLGWVIAPADVIAKLIGLATATTYGVPGFVQDAGLFALQQGDALEARIAAPFARRRKLALDLLNGHNSLRLLPPGGAMYLFLGIRATGMSGTDFANALLDQHHIAVMPGESFGAAAAGHIRVAMTVEDTRFSAALQTLIAFAETRVNPR